MKKSNIKSLIIGAESASSKILKAMNKKISLELIKTACHKISEHKINTGTFWIIGHPGSSQKEEEKTLAAIEYLLRNKLSDYIEIACFVPYPGTAIFNNPTKFRIEILDWDFEKWSRLESRPIYRLKDFSEKDIHSYLKKIVKLIENYGQKIASDIKI